MFTHLEGVCQGRVGLEVGLHVRLQFRGDRYVSNAAIGERYQGAASRRAYYLGKQRVSSILRRKLTLAADSSSTGSHCGAQFCEDGDKRSEGVDDGAPQRSDKKLLPMNDSTEGFDIKQAPASTEAVC